MLENQPASPRPLFLIGCPRSGTTLLLRIMAMHHELAWVSQPVNFYPSRLGLTRLNRIYEFPLIGPKLYQKRAKISRYLPGRLRNYVPFPVEPWRFWNSYVPGFQRELDENVPPLPHREDEISDPQVRELRSAVASICTFQRKSRFLSKYTDFPRMKMLLRAFPDAQFVHILRDGRAVARSYLDRIRRGGFNTWEEREWWVRGWPSEWRDQWRQDEESPLGFTAYQWKYFVSEIRNESKAVACGQYLEVRYSDLIADPITTVKEINRFGGLTDSPRQSRGLQALKITDMDHKWRDECSAEEVAMLDAIVADEECAGTLG